MTDTAKPNPVSAERLKAHIDKIEKLNDDKAAVGEDLKEVFSLAKGEGFDTVIIRKIVALRKKEANKRREEQELLDLYMSAIGMED